MARSRRKRTEKPPEVRIGFYEAGTSGLKEAYGFVQEAYNTQLYWPQVQPLYSRLRTSMPEIVLVRNVFSNWSRNITPVVELPDNPTDDDLRYQDFIESDFDNMEGGFGRFLETALNHVPFFGWGWWELVPGVRSQDWRPPTGDDDWRSEANDGLIGLRRLAWRDSGSFKKWEFDERKRLKGMWQEDYPLPEVFLPKDKALHLTFGDANNPEGQSPLEAIWRLERIRYGLEVVQGIGYEHAAGHLSITKTESGAISQDDKNKVREAAKALLSAQEGNYALWPFGLTGEIKDVDFQAGASILDAIKHYSIMVLSVYMMQFAALNTLTSTGALSSQVDSTDIAITTYNAMLDGFAAQYDDQVGRRLYEWNKHAFPKLTKRPRITFSHLNRNLSLRDLGGFLKDIDGIIPLGDDDYKALRRRSDVLSEALPEPTAMGVGPTPTNPPEEEIEEALARFSGWAQANAPSVYTMLRRGERA